MHGAMSNTILIGHEPRTFACQPNDIPWFGIDGANGASEIAAFAGNSRGLIPMVIKNDPLAR